MKRLVKYLVTLLYKPILSRYLSHTRVYRYGGLRLVIPPDVFHPGFFFSTRILLRYIDRLPLRQLSFLELGAGNGLIAMQTARRGARVVASDINPVAIEYLQLNQSFNKVNITIVHSDLFNEIPVQRFDCIAINPPYYKRAPASNIDHAWYCGEQGEYFDRLFGGLGKYVHGESEVLMILSDDCDRAMIDGHAARHGWAMKPVYEQKNWMERLYILSVKPFPA